MTDLPEDAPEVVEPVDDRATESEADRTARFERDALPFLDQPVSYTHLTLPTNREV